MMKRVPGENNVHYYDQTQIALDHIFHHQNAAQKLPDIVLLDLHMPLVDGWEFLEALNGLYKSLSKSITVYVITSSIREADKDNAKRFHFVKEFVSKPLSTAKLTEILENFSATMMLSDEF
jgi:CheY-like chemotaxis protein